VRSLEMQFTGVWLAKRNADVKPASFEHSLTLFQHHGSSLVGLGATEKGIESAFVDNYVKKLVSILQVGAVHHLPCVQRDFRKRNSRKAFTYR